MALPCPACRKPIGLTLEFIMKHPVTVCPHCEVIMDFTINEEIKKSFTEAVSEIDKIKKSINFFDLLNTLIHRLYSKLYKNKMYFYFCFYLS